MDNPYYREKMIRCVLNEPFTVQKHQTPFVCNMRNMLLLYSPSSILFLHQHQYKIIVSLSRTDILVTTDSNYRKTHCLASIAKKKSILCKNYDCFDKPVHDCNDCSDKILRRKTCVWNSNACVTSANYLISIFSNLLLFVFFCPLFYI